MNYANENEKIDAEKKDPDDNPDSLKTRKKIFVIAAAVCIAAIGIYAAWPLMPFKTRGYLKEGERLLKEHRYSEAITSFNLALKEKPRLVKAWMNIGLALDELGRPREAVEHLNKALEISPRDPKVWVYKGNALAGMGMSEEAMACYEKAIEINPKYPGAWGNKFYLLRRMERYGEAKEAFEIYAGLEAPDLKFNITAEIMDEVIASLRPLIEEKTGIKFREKIRYSIVEPHELKEIAKRRIVKQWKTMYPSEDEKDLEEQAKIQAEFYSEIIPSMYEFTEGTLYIVPVSFQQNLLILKPEKESIKNILKLVVAHDLVHALDNQNYDVSSKLFKAGNQEELDALDSIIEGHAMHVTRQLGFSSKEWDAASGFSSGYLGEASPFNQAATQFVSVKYKNIYLRGEEFVIFVNTREGPAGIERLFKKPPLRNSVILTPETYYIRKKKVLSQQDYLEISKSAEELLPDKENWKGQAGKINEGSLRNNLSVGLSSAELDEIFKGFDEGFIVSYLKKESACVSLLLFKFRNAEDADKFLDAELKAMKARWNKSKGIAGEILEVLKDKKILIPGTSRAYIKEAIITPSPNKRTYTLTVMAVSDNYVCELSSVNQQITIGKVKRVVSNVFTKLEEELVQQ